MKRVLLISNSVMISLADTEYAEDVNVTANTEKVTMDVRNHFLTCPQFMGLLASSFWNSTMKGSSTVPAPLYGEVGRFFSVSPGSRGSTTSTGVSDLESWDAALDIVGGLTLDNEAKTRLSSSSSMKEEKTKLRSKLVLFLLIYSEHINQCLPPSLSLDL